MVRIVFLTVAAKSLGGGSQILSGQCLLSVIRSVWRFSLIGLMPLERTNAENIAYAIKDVILRLGLYINDAKAQCYDGCSTMTGVRTGVATRVKEENQKCSKSPKLLLPCFESSCWRYGQNVPLLKEVLNNAYELTKLVKYSPKRQAAKQKSCPFRSKVCQI